MLQEFTQQGLNTNSELLRNSLQQIGTNWHDFWGMHQADAMPCAEKSSCYGVLQDIYSLAIEKSSAIAQKEGRMMFDRLSDLSKIPKTIPEMDDFNALILTFIDSSKFKLQDVDKAYHLINRFESKLDTKKTAHKMLLNLIQTASILQRLKKIDSSMLLTWLNSSSLLDFSFPCDPSLFLPVSLQETLDTIQKEKKVIHLNDAIACFSPDDKKIIQKLHFENWRKQILGIVEELKFVLGNFSKVNDPSKSELVKFLKQEYAAVMALLENADNVFKQNFGEDGEKAILLNQLENSSDSVKADASIFQVLAETTQEDMRILCGTHKLSITTPEEDEASKAIINGTRMIGISETEESVTTRKQDSVLFFSAPKPKIVVQQSVKPRNKLIEILFSICKWIYEKVAEFLCNAKMVVQFLFGNCCPVPKPDKSTPAPLCK
ncbi:MAG: hypothetical protein A2X78_01605 [Gammaproteobacteria bacterium GWE2_37_16]|nr:MAG: hypothetical protein A2X78_01605 [Gammaproteobacteria bacterium GWE2_37_16]